MGSQKDCTVGSVAFCAQLLREKGVGTALMPITQNEPGEPWLVEL